MDSTELIAGVGNEVLTVIVFTIIVLVLSLAWYSTYLTPTQTTLNPARLRVENLRINSYQHPSTAEHSGPYSSLSSAATSSTTEQSHSTTSETEVNAQTPAEQTMPEQTTPQQNSNDPDTSPLSETADPFPSTTENSASHGPPAGSIRLRLKYLTDTEQVVVAKRHDTFQQFRSQHFAAELRENKQVRFIYNGQALQDSRTIQSYNITENTVIHVLITENTAPTREDNPQSQEVVFNAGSMMVPLFTIILLLIWYLRLEFGQFFNATSTISLICITFAFGFCVLIQRVHHPGVQIVSVSGDTPVQANVNQSGSRT